MGENEKFEDVFSDESSGNGATPDEAFQKLQEDRNNLYDRLLRKQAEFDNFRKRSERERSEYVQFASSELMRELLNALDSFDLAIRNASPDSPAAESMLKGFGLIHKQIQDTLARFGLKPIQAQGAKFDPEFHQAVATVEKPEVDENTVVEEMRKGYTLNGRLLRPAMVSVSVKGSKGTGD